MITSNKYKAAREHRAIGCFRAIVFYPSQNSECKHSRFTVAESKALSYSFLKEIDFEKIQKEEIDLASNSFVAKSNGETMPLVIFCSPSLPSAHQSFFSSLAKNGYIVISLYHKNASIIESQESSDIINMSSTYDDRESSIIADYLDFLNILTNANDDFSSLIDLKKMHIIGYSLGGSAAIKIAAKFPGFLTCTNIDGSIFGEEVDDFESLPPLLLIDHDTNFSMEDGEELRTHLKSRRHIVESSNNVELEIQVVPNSNHISFSDLSYIDKKDEFKVLDRTHSLILDFLQKHE